MRHIQTNETKLSALLEIILSSIELQEATHLYQKHRIIKLDWGKMLGLFETKSDVKEMINLFERNYSDNQTPLRIINDDIASRIKEANWESGHNPINYQLPNTDPVTGISLEAVRRSLFVEILDESKINDITDSLSKRDVGTVGSSFDDKTGILSIGNLSIKISKTTSSDSCRLLRTLFADKTKDWSTDEIYDDWDGVLGQERAYYKGKIYQAMRAANDKIAIETGIKDFLQNDGEYFRVNKKYLDNT